MNKDVDDYWLLVQTKLDLGVRGDLSITVDDGSVVNFHQHTVAFCAPKLHRMVMQHAVQSGSYKYMHLKQVSRQNLIYLRKFMYTQRLVVPTAVVNRVLFDGLCFDVFDFTMVKSLREGGPPGEYYLFQRTLDMLRLKPGMTVFDEGLIWQVGGEYNPQPTAPDETGPYISGVCILDEVPSGSSRIHVSNVPPMQDPDDPLPVMTFLTAMQDMIVTTGFNEAATSPPADHEG